MHGRQHRGPVKHDSFAGSGVNLIRWGTGIQSLSSGAGDSGNSILIVTSAAPDNATGKADTADTSVYVRAGDAATEIGGSATATNTGSNSGNAEAYAGGGANNGGNATATCASGAAIAIGGDAPGGTGGAATTSAGGPADRPADKDSKEADSETSAGETGSDKTKPRR